MSEPTTLYQFIIDTVTKPSRLARAMHQPQTYFLGAFDKGVLSEGHLKALLSGDAETITRALNEEAGITEPADPVALWVMLIVGPPPPPPPSPQSASSPAAH